MVLLAFPMVLVSGLVYSMVTGKRLQESMFRVYAVLQNTPGAPTVLERCSSPSQHAQHTPLTHHTAETQVAIIGCD